MFISHRCLRLASELSYKSELRMFDKFGATQNSFSRVVRLEQTTWYSCRGVDKKSWSLDLRRPSSQVFVCRQDKGHCALLGKYLRGQLIFVPIVHESRFVHGSRNITAFCHTLVWWEAGEIPTVYLTEK